MLPIAPDQEEDPLKQRGIGLLMVALVGVGPLAAQSPAQSSASADLPSLAKALEGRWKLDISMQPPGAPAAVTGSGEESWHRSLDGLTLIEEERLSFPGDELRLLAIVWRDKRTNIFHGMQCNNNDPLVCDLKGALNDITLTWDGRQFVMEEQETTSRGDKRTYRETYSDITATSFTQTGEIRPQGADGFARVMTMHATRTN
jgi:hypothetical protein